MRYACLVGVLLSIGCRPAAPPVTTTEPEPPATGTPAPDEPRTTCPGGMVLVPADGAPAELVPFCIGETEVSVGEYRACVEAGNCTAPEEEMTQRGAATWLMNDPLLPINYLTPTQAKQFCDSVGGRLPTKDEWFWAAGSARGWGYPWGDFTRHEVEASYCGQYAPENRESPLHHPCPARQYPEDRTEQGAYDMGGSLGELVQTDASGDDVGIATTWATQYTTPPEPGEEYIAERSGGEPLVLTATDPGGVDHIFAYGSGGGLRCAAWPT